ncbi:MAG: hypothetical protein ACJA0N_000421 [Pseudohongiellaceae bacterium]|jgi:hypothetical protein
MTKIGRNDPCPCGSGKKYKKCCLATELEQRAQANPATEINQSLAKAFAGQQFESLDDMQVFADHKINQLNEQPQEELGGFSPNQLQTLFHEPMNMQEFIQWHDDIAIAEFNQAPIMAIFHSMKNYLAHHKAKATTKGNFSIALVKQVFSEYESLFNDGQRAMHLGNINKEQDFRDLHIAKLTFKSAGLLRKYKGCFELTKKAQNINDSDLFKLLITHYIYQYNWGHEDGYPEADFFQTACWYSLVTLNRLKNSTINNIEFAEEFIRIFPSTLDEFTASPYQISLKAACNAYSVRTIERFWRFFGLITLKGERYTPGYNQTMLATPLLQQVFTFKN